MTIAHNKITAGGTAALPTLLPGPSEVLGAITARTAGGGDLLVVGLLRRDDTWPLSSATLTAVTATVAGDIRGEDWLGRSGPAEFAVLVDAGAAEVVAERLMAAVATAAAPVLSASAGVARLEPGVAAPELLRRATLSLSTARSLGAGTTIRYSGTR